MKVLYYHNHPSYDPTDILNGYDLSVYIVNDVELMFFQSQVMHFSFLKKELVSIKLFLLFII